MDIIHLFTEWSFFAVALPPTVLGLFMVTDEVKAFTAARVCFWISALGTWGKIVWWSTHTTDNLYSRSLVVFIACGLIGVGLTEALRLATKREVFHTPSTPSSGGAQSPLPSIPPKPKAAPAQAVRGKTSPKKSRPATSQPQTATQPQTQTATQPQQGASALYCGKTEHLPEGMTSNCGNVEIGENHYDGFTSVFENAGKAEGIVLRGNIVQPSTPNQTVRILKNDPSGEMKNVTAENNEAKPAPAASQSSANLPAALAVPKGRGVERWLIEGNATCEGQTLISNSGDVKDFVIRENKSVVPCEWIGFLGVLESHRSETELIMGNWTKKMEEMWSSLAEADKKPLRDELQGIEAKIRSAATDPDKFSQLIKQLRTTPPTFKMPS